MILILSISAVGFAQVDSTYLVKLDSIKSFIVGEAGLTGVCDYKTSTHKVSVKVFKNGKAMVLRFSEIDKPSTKFTVVFSENEERMRVSVSIPSSALDGVSFSSRNSTNFVYISKSTGKEDSYAATMDRANLRDIIAIEWATKVLEIYSKKFKDE